MRLSHALRVGVADAHLDAAHGDVVREGERVNGRFHAVELDDAVATGKETVAVMEDVGTLGRSVHGEGGDDLPS